jgi:hypothetical protein
MNWVEWAKARRRACRFGVEVRPSVRIVDPDPFGACGDRIPGAEIALEEVCIFRYGGLRGSRCRLLFGGTAAPFNDNVGRRASAWHGGVAARCAEEQVVLVHQIGIVLLIVRQHQAELGRFGQRLFRRVVGGGIVGDGCIIGWLRRIGLGLAS